MARKAPRKRPGRGSDQFMVRFPSGMREEIAQEAQQTGRSMNAEIVARLEASFQTFLNREGLVAVSKRLEAAAVAFEQLFWDARDRRAADDGSEPMAPRAHWSGFLRLSLVTCPIALYPAVSHTKNVSLTVESHSIELLRFVPRNELDPLYIVQPYYLVPDGKVGQDAFAVIRETIRATNKIALSVVALTNGQRRLLAIDARGRGMVGMLLRHENEVRNPAGYFDDIQDIEVGKDMLDLSRHIIERMSGHFESHEFEEYCKQAFIEKPVNQKAPPDRLAEPPSNVINLMDALRKSVA
jgi:DNA end-binding protein Ku